MQQQQNCSLKTWHIDTKIISNGSSKISFVSLLRKKTFFCLYISCFGILIFRLGVKNCIMKNEKWIAFPKLQHLKNKWYYLLRWKKLPPPPSILVTINRSSLLKVKAKRILGIIIDEDLTFTPHVEYITQKCKIAYNRLTLYSDLSPHLALQLYKAFIRSKLQFGCTVYSFRI